MKLFDLFAGIGGFSLGLQNAGFDVVGQCENDPFCKAILARHWPDVWRHDDVRTLTGSLIRAKCGRIAALSGGFPCQDVSDAGFQAGITGRRSGLWGEFCRLIREIDPLWTIIENVDGLRRRGLGVVLADLAACGRDAEWRVLGASDFGAPHVRERIFILAYPSGVRLKGHGVEALGDQEGILEKVERWARTRPPFDGIAGRTGKRLPHARFLRMVDGIPTDVDTRRVAALGNAIVPQITELIGRAILEAA